MERFVVVQHSPAAKYNPPVWRVIGRNIILATSAAAKLTVQSNSSDPEPEPCLYFVEDRSLHENVLDIHASCKFLFLSVHCVWLLKVFKIITDKSTNTASIPLCSDQQLTNFENKYLGEFLSFEISGPA